ncbi:MAG: transketolase [Planctomycetota bacterium]|nr:transketolase [Planctomycetota bacterium]
MPTANSTLFVHAGTPANVPMIDALAINTIRTLSIDAVQAAESGHPGTPMGLAPVAYSLFQDAMQYDPAHPHWMNRDRFVLSNGHASLLLYSVLHLAGVRQVDASGNPTSEEAVSLDAIKQFRQLGSKTPGHPEFGWTTGVETTTGPLGQGIATAVGMAIAEKWLAARYNKPGFEIFSHRVWSICGDGCMMEGISSESASIAAHLGLDNLCWIYDSNRITIEGHTDLAFNEDVACRFEGYGWNVLHVADANDTIAVAQAFESARTKKEAPTLIIVESHIGWGSPKKQDTASAHGEALGADEIKAVKRVYGWPEDASFFVPEGVRERFQEKLGARGAELFSNWSALFSRYKSQYPELATEIELIQSRELPAGWDADLTPFAADPKGMATRVSGGKVLNAIAKRVPWMVGGAADLAPSTKTLIDGAEGFQRATPQGRNMHFGVREFGMSAACNGMALHGLRSYGASFFVFTDYARPAIRLSALMEIPVLWIFTHDSIGLGEDGPTHQPIEHLASLRAMPNLHVYRPCDANEVTECFRHAMLTTHHPSMMVLSRQNVPTMNRANLGAASGCARGAYVLRESSGIPQVILIGTGTEVPLCMQSAEQLEASGIATRVVSMPCWTVFAGEDADYRESVLPSKITARVAVEAASPLGWERWVGSTGAIIGMSTFGASAPATELYRHFGLTTDNIVAAAKAQLKRSSL